MVFAQKCVAGITGEHLMLNKLMQGGIGAVGGLQHRQSSKVDDHSEFRLAFLLGQ